MAADLVAVARRWGVIVLDAAGRVCGTNRSAETLLAQEAGLRLAGKRLEAADPRQRASFRELVRCSLKGSPRSGGILAVPRAAPLAALLVSVSPLDAAGSPLPYSIQVGALVALGDMDELPRPAEVQLGRMFGLTHAEARVAAAISRGETLREIATSQGVTHATIRTQLQQALYKTGTHRQAELVRIVLLATTPTASEALGLPDQMTARNGRASREDARNGSRQLRAPTRRRPCFVNDRV